MAGYRTPEAFDRDADWYNRNQERIVQQYPDQWVSVRNRKIVAVGPDPESLRESLRAKGMELSHTFHQPTIGYEVFMAKMMELARSMPLTPDSEIEELLTQNRLDDEFLDEKDEEFRLMYPGRLVIIHHQGVLGVFDDREEFITLLNTDDRFNPNDPLSISSVGRHYPADPEKLL